MNIPLAEHFHSIQGEGYWTGTPMHFIRLPGCTVGKKIDDSPQLPGGRPAWRCTAYNGHSFWCDTDFSHYANETGESLIKDTWEKHICLTGGEPLAHRRIVDYFRTACPNSGVTLHIETSGTIDFWWEADLHPLTEHGDYDQRDPWITVSPKEDWTPYNIAHAQELKLLVDHNFELRHLDPAFLGHPRVYLSPINDVGSGGLYHPRSRSALYKTMEVLKKYPHWKLSVQLHKYLGVQ